MAFSSYSCTDCVVTVKVSPRIGQIINLRVNMSLLCSGTLYISMEHCVRMVLTVDDRPSSTRLSSWVCVSVSVSSLVCSRVLLSIRVKHLHENTQTHIHMHIQGFVRLSAVKMSAAQTNLQSWKGCFGRPARRSTDADQYIFEQIETGCMQKMTTGFY